MPIGTLDKIEPPIHPSKATESDDADEIVASMARDYEYKPVPSEEIVAYLGAVVKDITQFFGTQPLPEEVRELATLLKKNPQMVVTIQEQTGYSYLQIQLWAGEMKSRAINPRPRTRRQLARRACSSQMLSGEAL